MIRVHGQASNGDPPLRSCSPSAAESAGTLGCPPELLAGFLGDNPHVRLDLVVSGALVDIVAQGYDAGVRLGEVVDKDMIAVPVSGDKAEGSPSAEAAAAKRSIAEVPPLLTRALRSIVPTRCVIRARLPARSDTTLPQRRRPQWLARRAHRPVRDARR